MRKHTLKMFRTTYRSEQFFSKLSLAKDRLCSRLTDINLETQLSVETTPVPPDIPELVEAKFSQSLKVRYVQFKV